MVSPLRGTKSSSHGVTSSAFQVWSEKFRLCKVQRRLCGSLESRVLAGWWLEGCPMGTHRRPWLLQRHAWHPQLFRSGWPMYALQMHWDWRCNMDRFSTTGYVEEHPLGGRRLEKLGRTFEVHFADSSWGELLVNSLRLGSRKVLGRRSVHLWLSDGPLGFYGHAKWREPELAELLGFFENLFQKPRHAHTIQIFVETVNVHPHRKVPQIEGEGLRDKALRPSFVGPVVSASEPSPRAAPAHHPHTETKCTPGGNDYFPQGRLRPTTWTSARVWRNRQQHALTSFPGSWSLRWGRHEMLRYHKQMPHASRACYFESLHKPQSDMVLHGWGSNAAHAAGR